MTIDINIVNGKLFLHDEFRDGGVSIEGEKIIKIGKEPSLKKASKTIDVKGSLILPGLIDIHVHLRDFKQSNKETIVTGTRAAISGGVTSVFDMPNNKPLTNSIQRIREKHKIIEKEVAANVGLYSLLPVKLDEMESLISSGIFGFKIYPADELYPPKNNQKLINYLEIIKDRLPFIIHPDNGYAGEVEKELYEKDIPLVEAFLKAHNQLEEAQALEHFLEIQKKVDYKLHCAHITAKETIQIFEEKKENNLLTGEISPHHLTLTSNYLDTLGSEAKCLPPLRTKEDQKALWKALQEDIIDIVATDHAPHTFKEKRCEFEKAASGIVGLETLAPVMFTHAAKGMISFEKLIPKMTSKPAEFIGAKKRGKLEEGAFGDILILKKEKGKIDPENFESKAKWTPFEGFEFKYRPYMVFVNGSLSKEDEHVISKARSGKLLKKKI